MKQKLKILMASAEIAPLAKVGGLADVVGSLPPALKKLNCDIRLIMPLYGSVDRKKYKLKKTHSDLAVPSGGKMIKINLWETKLPNSSVPIYLIEQNKYFGGKEIYAQKGAEKFLFFSTAALHVLPSIKFKPDVIHCHDSHTALIPDLLKAKSWPYLKNTKTLFTIHNLTYQGKSDIEVLKIGNLTKDSLKLLSRDAQNGDINFMVQGVLGADLVNTVSKTYSEEIATSIYGASLEKIIKKRKKDLYGILNGIDTNFFNPSTDKFIKKNYSFKTIGNKKINKLALQKKLGLPQDENIVLISLVSRLVWQKGLNLITKDFSKLNCQFVFLGTGQKEYEYSLKKLSKEYPDKFSAKIMFDAELAQQIYAGSDIFLMPSRFEPCGLGQMIAMRYGTVPVVRATGGLADTVDKKVGFSFADFTADALYKTLDKALTIYYKNPKQWNKLRINGMKRDFSWNKSAKEYLKLYKKLS